MITRTISCEKCHVIEQEKAINQGWHGWMILQGINWNGVENPALCPACTADVMAFIDK